ncbi:MAG: flippase-like domain-containing protein [Candidatus Bathyarchaeota archaeon]|nr:flippase-like domain-containing protein [Candidatus Bathyarchaeota archaeon]
MEIEKSSALKKGIPLLLLGLFVFLLYTYFFVGFTDFVNIFRLVDPFFYSLSFTAFLLSMTFYSLTWWELLRVLSVETAFRRPFLFTWVGAFVDLLIPAESVSGEVSRAYLMHKDSSENAGKIVASVVSHRILSMATTLGGLIVGSTLFIVRYEPSELVVSFILIVAVGTALSLFLLIYLSLKKEATKRVVKWLVNLIGRLFKGRLKIARLSSKVSRMLKEFHKGIEILGARPRKLVLPIGYSVLAWLFDLSIAFFVFLALPLPVQVRFSAIVIVYSIVVAVQTIPLGIPGEVGVIEIVMATLYRLLLPGIPPATIAAATILIRALTLWVKLVISGVAVQWVGFKMLKGEVL